MQGSWGQLGKRRATANSPGDRQNLQHKYLQQKTEKFHLLRGPDASTKLETGKRQMGESHVKTRTFIFCLADVKVA